MAKMMPQRAKDKAIASERQVFNFLRDRLSDKFLDRIVF